MSDDLAKPGTARSTAEQAEESIYRSKPPLWQSERNERLSVASIVGGVVLLLLAVAVLAVALEGYLLSVPMGQLEVTVLRIESGTASDEAPASFRHVVTLADGSERRFTSERLHRPGEKLIVTVSRGRLTGRVRLGAPYVVVGSPVPPQ